MTNPATGCAIRKRSPCHSSFIISTVIMTRMTIMIIIMIITMIVIGGLDDQDDGGHWRTVAIQLRASWSLGKRSRHWDSCSAGQPRCPACFRAAQSVVWCFSVQCASTANYHKRHIALAQQHPPKESAVACSDVVVCSGLFVIWSVLATPDLCL